jgi:DNA-binding Xre family transcriptional regulator
MILLKLNEMLEKRGLTAYALHVKSKKDGKFRLHQSVISKIKHNKSKALQIEILDLLCELLECQPSDLIVYESATQTAFTTQNVERATQNVEHTQSANTTQNVISFNDAVSRLGKADSSVRRYLNSLRLKGEKVNGNWQILESDLIEFQNSEWFQNL